MFPIKGRARIGLAAGGDVAVAGDACLGDGGIGLYDLPGDLGQGRILGIAIGDVVCPFQFDADGEIITAAAAFKLGLARMPGPFLQGYVLGQFTVAADQ
jgi:hypothetical protein